MEAERTAQECYERFVAKNVVSRLEFPMSQTDIDALSSFCDTILPCRRLAQCRWALASSPSAVTRAFRALLTANAETDEFGLFCIEHRITVWGYKFFENDEKSISGEILERLRSDFEWDYYLRNAGWYEDIPKPKSCCRLKYVDKP